MAVGAAWPSPPPWPVFLACVELTRVGGTERRTEVRLGAPGCSDGRRQEAARPPAADVLPAGLWAWLGAPAHLPELSRKSLPADWKNRHGSADSIAGWREGGAGQCLSGSHPRAREQRSACSAQAATWTERGEGRLPEDQHPGVSRATIPGGAGADAGHNKHGWVGPGSPTHCRARTPVGPRHPGAWPVDSRHGDPEGCRSPEERLPDTHTPGSTKGHLLWDPGWGSGDCTAVASGILDPKVTTELACSLKAERDPGHGPHQDAGAGGGHQASWVCLQDWRSFEGAAAQRRGGRR